MALIQAFSSLLCAILLSLVLYFVIKIYRITVENQELRVGTNQPQQLVAYGSHGSITTIIDDENQNHNIQGNRQVPVEHDERQGY